MDDYNFVAHNLKMYITNLKISKKLEKKPVFINSSKNKKREESVKRHLGGRFNLLNLVTNGLNLGQPTNDFIRAGRVSDVYLQVRGNVRKSISSKMRWSLPIFFAAATPWRFGVYRATGFSKIRGIGFKRLIGSFNKIKRRFVRRLGKKIRRHKKFNTVYSYKRRIRKSWLYLRRASFYSKVYSKKLAVPTEYKTRSKRRIRQTIDGFLHKKTFPIRIRLRNYDYSGCYVDSEDFDMCLPSNCRSKKFVREYLSAFLYNGKPMGSQFGVYLGFHFYVNQYIKRKFKRFTKRFDYVLHEDLNDYNEGVEDAFDAAARLNNYTLETKIFRRDELWYHKNHLRHGKCYLKNIVTGKKSGHGKVKRLDPNALHKNDPFTLFGRVFPISSFTENFVNERLIGLGPS